MKDPALVDAVKTDWRSAPLQPRQLAILEYAEKLTRTPGAMNPRDIDALKAAGLSEVEILDVIQITRLLRLRQPPRRRSGCAAGGVLAERGTA